VGSKEHGKFIVVNALPALQFVGGATRSLLEENFSVQCLLTKQSTVHRA